MSSTVSTTGGSSRPAASSADIESSVRTPLLYLFFCASGWLVLGSIFAFLASLKFHGPNILADCPWLTYGRIYPASLNAMIYGFAIPTALGVALWLACRLGRTTLSQCGLVSLGATTWNLGVAAGIIGILAGGVTGYEWLEMPWYAGVILFLSYLLIGIAAVLVFFNRSEPKLYVSQWFLLAALFWFPWIYSTANLLLLHAPVRGVFQEIVNWWYIANLNVVWTWFVGLAILFYFLPKLAGRPLHSRYLAMFAFWLIALVGGWTGIPHGAPVPALYPAVSGAMAIVLVAPLLAVAIIFWQTLAGRAEVAAQGPVFSFLRFSAIAFVVAAALYIAGTLQPIARITNLTYYPIAVAKLNAYGFLSMALFGAVYYIVPRLMRADWPLPKLVAAHYWMAMLGVILFVLPLVAGGVVQGLKLNDPAVPFMEMTKSTMMFFRLSTMGDLLMLAGHLMFAVNLKLLVYRSLRACWKSTVAEATAPMAEVKA